MCFTNIDTEPEYSQIYGYNSESYNPMLELQYLRERYYDVEKENSLTEDTCLGDISDPMTLNRYNYIKNNLLNYNLGIKLPDSTINHVFSILMSPPHHGRQKQWKITAHLVGTASAGDMLEMLGLMVEDGVTQLMDVISVYYSASGKRKL